MLLLNFSSNEIGQAAVGERDVRPTLKDNNLALFTQSARSRGRTGAARYPADHHQTSRIHLTGTEPPDSQQVTTDGVAAESPPLRFPLVRSQFSAVPSVRSRRPFVADRSPVPGIGRFAAGNLLRTARNNRLAVGGTRLDRTFSKSPAPHLPPLFAAPQGDGWPRLIAGE